MPAVRIHGPRLITASRDGETADETSVQRCRACGERFTITAKLD